MEGREGGEGKFALFYMSINVDGKGHVERKRLNLYKRKSM